MASEVARVMKRPAGRVGKTMASSASSPKKQKHGFAMSGDGPETVLSILKDELPQSTFEIFAAVVARDRQLDTSPQLQKHEEVAVQMAGKAFTDLENRFLSEAKEAQTKLSSVESGWAERSSALDATQAELLKIKAEIAEAKAGIKTALKAIESARQDVRKTKVAEKHSVGSAKLVSAKIGSLQAVEKDVFKPLKEASVKSSTGKKKLKHLQKVGKQFGFHDVLLNTTMPKVALKRIDKRQTFDNLVMEQMEAEFAKKHVELENALKDQRSAKLDSEAALQTAQDSLVDAQQQRNANALKLAKAESALASGRRSVVDARRQLRKFDADSQKIVRETSQAETELRSFLDGPFAAFKELEISLVLPSPNLRPPTSEAPSAEIQTALVRALTRIGTMTLPASPMEAEEDGDNMEDLEKTDDVTVEQVQDYEDLLHDGEDEEEEEEEENEKDVEETDDEGRAQSLPKEDQEKSLDVGEQEQDVEEKKDLEEIDKEDSKEDEMMPTVGEPTVLAPP